MSRLWSAARFYCRFYGRFYGKTHWQDPLPPARLNASWLI
jgi:hypothetical protein